MQFSRALFQIVLAPPDKQFSRTYVSDRSSTSRHAVLTGLVSDRSSTSRHAVLTDLCFRPSSTARLAALKGLFSDLSSTARVAILTDVCLRPFWHCQTCSSHGPIFQIFQVLPDLQFSWAYVSERSSTARHAILIAYVLECSSTARLALLMDICFRPFYH